MKFSIIVPCYNVEEYVEECIASLKAQTFSDFEVVLVDDCSSDATVDLVSSAIEHDDRFSLIRRSENGGLSVARNVGLSQAKGEYILFLDSDDAYVPQALSVLAQHLDAGDLDQLFFSAKTVYESRKLHRTCYEDQDNRQSIDGIMTGVDLFVRLEASGSFRPSACLFALRKSRIDEFGLSFREGILHEDLLFTLQTFPLMERTAFIHEALYIRRIREGSTMTQGLTMRHVDGHFQVGQELRRWLTASLDAYEPAFLQAFTRRVYETYNIGARYLMEIEAQDQQVYREKLALADRVDFDLYVYYPYLTMQGIYDEVCGSKTYRLGRVFMAGPSWLKSRLVLPE